MAFGKLLFLCACLVFAGASVNKPKDQKFHYEDHCKLGLNFTTHFISMAYVNEPKNDDITDDKFFSFELPADVYEWDLEAYGREEYIEAVEKNRVITFKPTEAFSNFEFETSTGGDTEKLELYVQFYCGEKEDYISSQFYFIQPITDVNNHKPTFNRKEYNYHFGMPIRQGAVLTSIMEIYAVDADYTNTKLNFTIQENDYLVIDYSNNDRNSKVHYATLKTKKEIPKDFSEVFTITATDVGTPKTSGTATVKIHID